MKKNSKVWHRARPEIRQSPTVLVVDDDTAVRSAIADLLNVLGHTTLLAESGKKALRIAETYDGTIDLLLSDVTMPGMNGRDLAMRLAQERPGLKVLLMSGYAENKIARAIETEELPYIQKPFSLEDIRLRIDAIMSQSNEKKG